MSDGKLTITSYSGIGAAHFDCFPQFSEEAMARARLSFEYEAAIRTYSEELEELFFRRGLPDIAPRDRRRYAIAITTMCHYMEHAGFSKLVVGELIEFVLALYELDQGTVRFFLKPTAAQNRPQDSGDIWVARAVVAHATELMTRSGKSRRQACKEIAEEYRVLANILSPTSMRDFAVVIESWHQALSRGSCSNSRAQERYNKREQSPDQTPKALMMTATLIAARAITPEALAAFVRSHRSAAK